MQEMMKALVITGKRGKEDFRYKEVPIPPIADDEVLVRVKACGICGSDTDRICRGGVHEVPIIVGHEFAGEVVKIGASVQGIEAGARVTAAPLIPCGSCAECSTGQPAMCTQYSFIGSRQDGAMAEYVRVPAKNIIPLAESVSFTDAAVIEPITVALHGTERAGELRSGESALVYGCGTIGILTMQILKAKGIERVYVIDIDPAKLELAKKLGAYETINSAETDVPAYFKAHGKVQYAFETAGVNVLQAQLPELVKKRGVIVYIGTSPRDVSFKAEVFEQILRGELFVTGSWMSYSAPFPGTEWTAAAEYLAAGKIVLDGIITHKFPLSAGYEAVATLTDRRTGALKVMYVMD